MTLIATSHSKPVRLRKRQIPVVLSVPQVNALLRLVNVAQVTNNREWDLLLRARESIEKAMKAAFLEQVLEDQGRKMKVPPCQLRKNHRGECRP